MAPKDPCIWDLCPCVILSMILGWTYQLTSNKYNMAVVMEYHFSDWVTKDHTGLWVLSFGSLTPREGSCYIVRQPYGEIHEVEKLGLPTPGECIWKWILLPLSGVFRWDVQSPQPAAWPSVRGALLSCAGISDPQKCWDNIYYFKMLNFGTICYSAIDN